MARKKKLSADTLVAAEAVAIDGKHFAAGDEIKDVDEEQLDIAVRLRRVITAAEFEGGAEPAADVDEEGESDTEGSTDEPAAA